MNTCEKYWWVIEHPSFMNKDMASIQVEIEPHMVCPLTSRIEVYAPLNTKLQLWIEVMTPYKEEGDKEYKSCHDWELDCGGWTYEEAIDSLYNKVIEKYGNYTQEDIEKKYKELYNVKISRSTITAKTRKLKTTWSLNEKQWSSDLLDDLTKVSYTEDAEDIKKTIYALTEHRKTCNPIEYEEIDEHLEKQRFHLYETELSLKYNIDLVRK